MIIIDIEASGSLDMKNGIWQIGAVEFENPKNTFLGESRIDDEDDVEEGALKVTGKTEEQLRDKSKQSQKELLQKFFQWVSKIENKTFVAHNTPFDYGYIVFKSKKYGLDVPFGFRTLDLHVFAVAKHFEIHKKLPMINGKSTFSLAKILEFCGIEDKRIHLKEGEVIQEGSPHNGLEDAKLEAECLSRILYGKIMFEEFREFAVPEYLVR